MDLYAPAMAESNSSSQQDLLSSPTDGAEPSVAVETGAGSLDRGDSSSASGLPDQALDGSGDGTGASGHSEALGRGISTLRHWTTKAEKRDIGQRKRWDSGSTVGDFDGHSKRVMSCDFKPTRPFRIVTCGEDFLVNLYEGPPFKFKMSIRMTDYRKDGHPSIYRKVYVTAQERIGAEQSQDCSHWCLPGVPDNWNELLYASLLEAEDSRVSS